MYATHDTQLTTNRIVNVTDARPTRRDRPWRHRAQRPGSSTCTTCAGSRSALAGLAAATQSATALASGFLAGTLSDRIGPKRVLVARSCVMTVAFALMPLIRAPWHAFAVYVVWGAGSGSFWPSQSALLAGLTPPSAARPPTRCSG